MNPYRLQLGFDLQPLVLAHADAPAELVPTLIRNALVALDSGADYVVIEASAAAAPALNMLATLARQRLTIRTPSAQALALARELRPGALCLLDTPDSATLEALVEQTQRSQSELFCVAEHNGSAALPGTLAECCAGLVVDLRDWSQEGPDAGNPVGDTIAALIDGADQHELGVHIRGCGSLHSAEEAATIGGVSAIELGTAILSQALGNGLNSALRDARERLLAAQQMGLEAALEQHEQDHCCADEEDAAADGEHHHCGCRHP